MNIRPENISGKGERRPANFGVKWREQENKEALAKPISDDEKDPVYGLSVTEFMDKYRVPRKDQLARGIYKKNGRFVMGWTINGQDPDSWDRIHSNDDLPYWHR